MPLEELRIATMDENSPEKEYTPENLEALRKKADVFRHEVLFNLDDAGSDPESLHFLLLAMSSLEQAERFFSLAALKQSQAIS